MCIRTSEYARTKFERARVNWLCEYMPVWDTCVAMHVRVGRGCEESLWWRVSVCRRIPRGWGLPFGDACDSSPGRQLEGCRDHVFMSSLEVQEHGSSQSEFFLRGRMGTQALSAPRGHPGTCTYPTHCLWGFVAHHGADPIPSLQSGQSTHLSFL